MIPLLHLLLVSLPIRVISFQSLPQPRAALTGALKILALGTSPVGCLRELSQTRLRDRTMNSQTGGGFARPSLTRTSTLGRKVLRSRLRLYPSKW